MATHDVAEVAAAYKSLRARLPRHGIVTVNLLPEEGPYMHLDVRLPGGRVSIAREVALVTGYHFNPEWASVRTWHEHAALIPPTFTDGPPSVRTFREPLPSGDPRTFLTRVLADSLYGDGDALTWRTDD